MSWVFAAVSRNPLTPDLKEKFRAIHSSALYTTDRSDYYFASAGPELTTLCHINHLEKDSGYLILGSPLWAVNDDYHFLTTRDWDNFTWDESDIKRLEGHYALVKWTGNYVKCWTDPIGLRDILIVETAWGYVITTRLDWATRMLEQKSFNHHALASHIVVGAGLGQDMIINGIIRVFKGMKAEISPAGCMIHQAAREFIKPSIFNRDELYADMMKRVLLPFKENRTLSLALSGGIDSRTIAGFMLHPDARKYKHLWNAHTIGSSHEADVKCAVQIAREMGIKHTIYEPTSLPVPEQWGYMQENLLSLRMDLFPSETNRYRFIDDLAARYQGVIDGGSGWLLRYNEFRVMGMRHKADILAGKWDKIIPNLVRNTSFFFNGETRMEMNTEMRTRTVNMLSQMPKPATIGLYNWLNQLYKEIQLPYFYSTHQIWTDNFFQDYMPNMSHIFMNNVLQIPPEQKLDNRMCYYFINKSNKRLLHILRTVHELRLPCQTKALYFAVYARIHHKLLPRKTKPYDIKLWNHLKEPILDRLHSSSVKQYEGYDWESLKSNIESFYMGNTENAYWIDHWLRFDFWRELISS